MLAVTDTVPARSQAERAYWLVVERIIRLELPPGSVLLDRELTAELGIGRTPVREALQRRAGDAPRIRHSGSSQPTGESMTDGGTVNLESGFPVDTVYELRRMGHDVKVGRGGFGGYQAIMRDDEEGVYYGASESRKDGHAAGY